MRRIAMRRVAVCVAVLALLAGSAGAASPAPRVIGPRTTGLARPVYTFRLAGATVFRCGFDSTRLHRCAARYSERLRPGVHYLRARAELPGGRRSGMAVVRVVVTALAAGEPVSVGRGPGVPATGFGAVWVPTLEGTLVRADPGSGRTSRIGGLPATPDGVQVPGCDVYGACWYADAAFAGDDAVWVASDYGGRIERIDPAAGRVTQTIAVAPRPGGLTAGGGYLWAFHTRGSTVSRVDPATGAVFERSADGVEGAGIAYARGGVWLLSSAGHGEVLRLDPATLAVTARVPLEPVGRLHPFREASGLVTDGDTLWAGNPNYNMVTELDAAAARVTRHIRMGPFYAVAEQPFGLALGDGDVWTAGRSGVGRIDARTGRLLSAIDLAAAGSGYASVAYGFGSAWQTNYDRGTVTRVTPSQAAE